jgi:hypothetical protein
MKPLVNLPPVSMTSVAIYCYQPFSLLKVPKCKIFDLMDSRDFYTIKPLWKATLGL